MYTSSIVTKYGDLPKVRLDVKAINEILSRQGDSLLIDAMSENVARSANLYGLNTKERENLVNSILNELKESLFERV